MTKSTPKIVIVGGGFGGLFTALDLNGAGEVTLINEEDHFLFRPMLYEYLSGEVEAWHIAPDARSYWMIAPDSSAALLQASISTRKLSA